jgi:hypothetical protein
MVENSAQNNFKALSRVSVMGWAIRQEQTLLLFCPIVSDKNEKKILSLCRVLQDLQRSQLVVLRVALLQLGQRVGGFLLQLLLR